MDIQRTLLIGAALLLSFMLVSEWVAFKAEKATPAAEMARLTAEGPAAMQSAAALPAVETSAALDDELPQAPASVETANPASEPVASDPGRIVSVYTDTLEVAIDLEGGDIVEVALPRFRAELDDPNTPFLLLENSGRRTYIAQSGLIGPDGIDRGGARTLQRCAAALRARRRR
jgi:YidC/Oxa1 family membrane protein insertase